MAYVYLPPRTSNFYPPGPPYLSGMRGLGDYAADMNKYRLAMLAYNRDLKVYETRKAAYPAALAAWKTQVAAVQQSNAAAADAYEAAAQRYRDQYAAMKAANVAKSKTLDATFGLKLPQSYYDGGACLTQAQHNSYASHCSTVRGLWGLGSLDANCGYKALPVCAYPSPPSVPTMTKPPAQPTEPKSPTAPTAPKPVAPPPVVTTTPSSSGGGGNTPVVVNTPSGPVVVPDSTPSDTPQQPAPTKQANLVMNGLLIVAVLGGGYLIYRTIKKPKAAA